MITTTPVTDKVRLGKVKKIYGFTFQYYICSRSLWYMDIVTKGFNAVKR
jgi:hypothetical protein